ncbi:MAG: hypothetical protein Q7S02_04330, partial [bacterium]|nr:hypothetical protein [bacterium]
TGNVANVSRVKLYKEAAQIGAGSGNTFNADGFVRIVLDSGSLVLTKDTPTYLEVKLDFNPKEQHVSGVTFRTGLGDSAGTTSALASSEWAAAGSYNVTATGRDSGATIANANSTGAAGGTVDGGSTFASFDGVLSVGLDAGSPSGTQTPAAGRETFRFWLTATGDEVTVFDVAFTPSGTAAAVTGTGAMELRGDSVAGNFQTLYADWADSSVSAGAGAAHTAFHVNNGVSATRSAAADGTEGWDQLLTISAGSTKVLRLSMDTSSLTTASRSYQLSVLSVTAIDAGLDSGISWADGEVNGLNGVGCPNASEANVVAGAAASFGGTTECTVDSTVYTKTLPLNGGALTY